MGFNHFFNRQILTRISRKWLSHQTGKLASIKFPPSINQKIIKKFINYYQIDLKELEKPVEEYKSLGEFFFETIEKVSQTHTLFTDSPL